MSEYLQVLQIVVALTFPPIKVLACFPEHIPYQRIAGVLQQTGHAAVYRRRFPAEQAVWLVLGIGMMCNCSIADIREKWIWLSRMLKAHDHNSLPVAS